MSLQEWRRVQGKSFGVAAGAYERGRPPYPAEAIDWLVPEQATRVVDLGAGTGKLTRQLHERGLDVIAVEPSDGMREQLRQAVPGVPVLGGNAEHLPLADDSVDALLVAQAWHWVEPSLAVPEAARVPRTCQLLHAAPYRALGTRAPVVARNGRLPDLIHVTPGMAARSGQIVRRGGRGL